MADDILNSLTVRDLKMLSYEKAMMMMRDLHRQIAQQEIGNQLMLLMHEPVITTTQKSLFKNIHTDKETLLKTGINLHIVDRGGDVTFHGPGQLVGYPLIKLPTILGAKTLYEVDVGAYIRRLETALYQACLDIGVKEARLIKGLTGIFVVDPLNEPKIKKLIAIGVGVALGTTKHGFALNIDIDYQRYTDHITPCGLKNFGIISLAEIFSLKSLEMPAFSDILVAVSENIAKAFGLSLVFERGLKDV